MATLVAYRWFGAPPMTANHYALKCDLTYRSSSRISTNALSRTCRTQS